LRGDLGLYPTSGSVDLAVVHRLLTLSSKSRRHMRHRGSAQRSRLVLSDPRDHGAHVFAAREPEVHNVYSETEQRGPDQHAQPHEIRKRDTGYRQRYSLSGGL
jgi:hypothetical protein